MLELEPKKVWDYFEKFSAIPRPSGREKAAGDYVLSVAKEHGIERERDKVGNVLIRVPATPGREGAPVTVLQGHLDMVCEKNAGVEHDFLKDPLRLRVEGGVVKATGTTLGADNGLGVAMALALLDEPAAEHGPLELLFTVDEERGLNGANGLQPGFVRGRRLLNLDTEEDASLYVGCAGGQDTALILRVVRAKGDDPRPAYQLLVKGLRGGHSGGDIHEGRGNANRIIARVLDEMDRRHIAYGLGAVNGGSKHNAIPREAFATLYLDQAVLEPARAAVAELQEIVRQELKGVDDGVCIEISAGQADLPPLTKSSHAKVVALLMAVPHGLMSYCREIPGSWRPPLTSPS